jgi:hypothetical protein
MSGLVSQRPSMSATPFFAIVRSVLDHYTDEQDAHAAGTWRGELQQLALELNQAVGEDLVVMDATVRYVGVPRGLRVLMTLLSQPDPFRGPRDTLQHVRQDATEDASLATLVAVLEPGIAKVIAPLLEERLSRSDCPDLVRSAFRDLFAPKHQSNLLKLVGDLTRPDYLPVIQDISRFAAESVTEDVLPQVTKLIAGVVCAAVGNDSSSDMAEALAEPCLAWARATVRSWTHDDPDEWLDIKAAAAYLGVRPKTLHLHIRNHAGKPSELPVERRTGPGYRGHGKYFIRVGDLNEWATTHWNSPRKRVLATISSTT